MRAALLLTGLVLVAGMATAQRAISSEEALATAHRIEAATNSGDASALNHFFDLDSLMQNCRKKSQALKDPAFLKGFSESFGRGFANYGDRIVAAVHLGNYRLLKEYERKGVRHLLFRMFGTGGLNYHDYTLVRSDDSIKASDVYVYQVDESLSGTIATLADMMSKSLDNVPEDVSIMIKLTDENSKKNYSAVKEQYEHLAGKYKNTKSIQLIYISACHHLDPSLYETALEHFSTSFPDAASCYLMMIDLYYLRKEYDKGFAALGRMDKLIGGDPVLDLFRGNFYKQLGKKAESLACYEKVYQYDPTLAANTRLLVQAYEEGGDKVKARAVMTDVKKTAAFRESDFSDLFSTYPDLK